MIGKPIIDPRDVIISELEAHKLRFLEAGNTIEIIPTGLSGIGQLPVTNGLHKQQQLERAKLAPALRQHAADGATLREAAKALKLKTDRAQLIATEHRIQFNRSKPLIISCEGSTSSDAL